MPFFDRAGKEKPPDLLERLRQYSSQPVPPPAPTSTAPPAEPAVVAPSAAPATRRAELDAVMEEAVGAGSPQDNLTGEANLKPLTRPVAPPAREAESVDAFMTAAAAPPAPAPLRAPVSAAASGPAVAPVAASGPIITPPGASPPPAHFGTPPPAAPAKRFAPQRPKDIDSTGLSRVFLSDHVLRTVYFAGEITRTVVVDQFRQIFKLVARSRGIEYDEDTFSYLLDRHYRPAGRPLRLCQPRDLLDQLIAIARYKMLKPEMTPGLVDAAASTYFVSMGPVNDAR